MQFLRAPFFEFHRGFVLRKSLKEPIHIPAPRAAVSIRQATLDDLALLETIVPPLRVKRLAKKMQAGELRVVAIQEQRVVAYVLAGFANTPSTEDAQLKLGLKEAYLWAGYALPQYRRQGVVRAVNLSLYRLLREDGYESVVLLVDRHNMCLRVPFVPKGLLRDMEKTRFLRKKSLFRHLPPTAVPVKGNDLWRGLAATFDPKGSLARFQSDLMARTGSANCYLVSSGRAAQTVILLALKRLSDRSQVVIPAYSCPTVVQAVMKAGLDPILCDVSPRTLDLDRIALSRLVGRDLLAIVPTHLYGLAQDVTDVVAIGREYGIFVIEDAAQAFGAMIRGQMVGSGGDAGFYSLGLGKCVPTGHGGVIVAQERCALAISEAMRGSVAQAARWDIRSLALFLGYGLATRPAGWWFVVRTPLNPEGAGTDIQTLPPIRLEELSAAQAGIGMSILARLDQINATRRRNALRLMAHLAEFDFVTLPEIPPGAEPVFLRLPIVVEGEDRANRLFGLLWRDGIGVGRSYQRTLPDLFSGVLSSNRSKFSGASRLADCLLTLPTHPYLREEDFVRITRAFQTIDRK